MALTSLVEAIGRYVAAGGVADMPAATDAEAIQRVADALRLELPHRLQQLYATYDYVEYGPEETLSVRQFHEHYDSFHQLHSPLSRSLLPIMLDDIGGYYVVVCREKGKPADSEFGCVMYVPACQPSEVELRDRDVLSFLASRIELRLDGL